MNTEHSEKVCPVEKAGMLDNSFRKIFQNPQKILKPYIKEGMTVLDLGCGPGFFSIEIARLLNNTGKVICADLQEGMLEVVRQKIAGTDIESRIQFHQCDSDGIHYPEKVDFILAFYMIHEVPDHARLFKEIKSMLTPNGQFLIIEPKFHVPKKSFVEMMSLLKATGFEIIDNAPQVSFSRSAWMRNR